MIPERLGHQCYQYADDVSVRMVFDRNESFEYVQKTAIKCLNEIRHFSIGHGLALNSDKTQALIIAKKNIRDNWKGLHMKIRPFS